MKNTSNFTTTAPPPLSDRAMYTRYAYECFRVCEGERERERERKLVAVSSYSS